MDREESGIPISATTRLEQLLVVLLFAVLPFENALPKFHGRSTAWALYAVATVAVVLFRPNELWRVARHRVVVAAGAFLVLAVLFESLDPNASYSIILSTLEMFLGAVTLTALCRDRSALMLGLVGFVAADTAASAVVIHLARGELHIHALNFQAATAARLRAFPNGEAIHNDINYLSYLFGEGAVVALMLGHELRSLMARVVVLAASLTCMIAAVLTLSRSGLLILVLGYCFALVAVSRHRLRRIVLAAVLFVLGAAIVPEVVIRRLSLTLGPTSSGQLESRGLVLEGTYHTIGQYFWTGIGSGNFFSSWAATNGFLEPQGTLSGPHDSYVATVMYWGILTGLTFLLVVVLAGRCCPSPRGNPIATAICAIALMTMVHLAFDQDLYEKANSVVLALLICSDVWLWSGAYSSVVSRERLLWPSRTPIGPETSRDVPAPDRGGIQAR
jgi:hypothetical protein